MIKDAMVWLDGTSGDERRLAAAGDIAGLFASNVVGLFVNALPDIVPPDGISTALVADLFEKARRAGDEIEGELMARLRRLGRPTEIRRFDALPAAIPDIAARAARSSDVFIDLRPDATAAGSEAGRTIEAVLFGSGRHLLLLPGDRSLRARFSHALVAWDGRREAARGMAEALPYLRKAQDVTVMVATQGDSVEDDALIGPDAVAHLQHHGIEAELRHIKTTNGELGPALIREAQRLEADLMVMGGYGHSRLREWLLGGVTEHLLHHAPVPLVIAH